MTRRGEARHAHVVELPGRPESPLKPSLSQAFTPRQSLRAGLCALAVLLPGSTLPPRQLVNPADWPTYGHDLNRSFSNQTVLTSATASGLLQAWFFPTGSATVNGAVSAQPIVVNGSVYVGS